MFTRADAYVHRIWKTLRTASGWMLLLALAVSAIGWWRRSQRALAADAFGSGSAEYEEFLFRQSPEGHHQREYRNDWLVNGVPEQGEKGFRQGGERPRFGRKAGGA